VQTARMGESPRGDMPTSVTAVRTEHRVWIGLQVILSLVLAAALGYALAFMRNPSIHIPLPPLHRVMLEISLWAGVIVFGTRTVELLLRFLHPSPRE
jgi:tetrahydromethanopterin S-methyltransferase subunit C